MTIMIIPSKRSGGLLMYLDVSGGRKTNAMSVAARRLDAVDAHASFLRPLHEQLVLGASSGGGGGVNGAHGFLVVI